MLTKERKRQKQLSRGALRKKRSENTQQTHRRTPTPKHDLSKAASQLHETMPRQGCPPQIHCILTEHPPQEHLWTAASEEREKYRKVYIKNFILKFMKIY